MTVSNIINIWLENALQLPFIVNNDIIQNEDEDGACLRYDPAPAAERRYDDGSRLVTHNLTYYIRCESATDARNYAQDIINTLDGQTIIDPESNRRLEIEAQTLPQFINSDDKNYTTYAAAIVCTYLEEK